MGGRRICWGLVMGRRGGLLMLIVGVEVVMGFIRCIITSSSICNIINESDDWIVFGRGFWMGILVI